MIRFSARRARRRIACALLLGSLAGAELPPAVAGDSDPGAALPRLASDLTKLSFDDLLKVEVISVSRHAEPAGTAPAALFVLTAEEIRRSGVRSIAEALRLVPGLEVARSNIHQYDISARGFNSSSADKLEVLLDGRSVYTPLTSAVFWDVLDTYLPDIDRIEVIRGPGATLWGANAVNGVINIITKSAAETQGASARAYGGNEELYGGAARLGARVGEAGSLRIYTQGYARDSSVLADGSRAPDGTRLMQSGFRSDWNVGGAGALTVSGDAYQGSELGNTITASGGTGPADDTGVSGGNLLARYSCCAGDDGRWWLQGSYEGYYRRVPTVFSERRQTAAVEFQQQWLFGARQTVVYGAGVKLSHDDTGLAPDNVIVFDPAKRRIGSYSAFVQDQIVLFEGGTLTLGSKFEHNSFSGFEVQPGARFGWKASDSLYTWAAISRAVRTPNRLDQDIAIYCPQPNGYPGVCGPGLYRIGNPRLDSEKLIAYEWGLNLRTGSGLSWNLAAYFNDYTRLRSVETTSPLGAFDNRMKAQGYGAELWAIWQPLPTLELRPSYSLLVLDASRRSGSTDVNTAPTLEGSNPRHQAGLVIYYEPRPAWHFSGFLRYVDTLAQTSTPSAASGSTRVPAYTELNLRIAHSFPHGLELGLVGENLLHSHHPEFGAAASRSELQRSLLLDLRWNWR